jgi:hypothetical protein
MYIWTLGQSVIGTHLELITMASWKASPITTYGDFTSRWEAFHKGCHAGSKWTERETRNNTWWTVFEEVEFPMWWSSGAYVWGNP